MPLPTAYSSPSAASATSVIGLLMDDLDVEYVVRYRVVVERAGSG
jgi:hypothetical protein